MSSQQVKNVVVFGATGLQGSAFIQALSSHAGHYAIYALSRSPSASSSVKLSKLPGVKVIQVNKDYMDQPELAFAATGLEENEVYGVFNVQGYVSEKAEIAQGKAIIDSSKRWRVKHFIYSSVCFGGLEDTGSSVFEVKRTLENYLIKSGISYTMLRPTQFMDNLLPTSPFVLKIARTVLLRNTFIHHPERKHQMISGRDIGRAGSEAMVNPDKWLNGIIELAGDELTAKEIEQVYTEVMGKQPELTFAPLAAFAKWISPAGPMARFFDDHGFGVNIPKLREDLPQVGFEDLRSYLERHKAAQ